MLLQHSAAQQNGVDVQLLVEQHDIREPSRFERAVVVFDAEGAGGVGGRRAHRLAERNAHADRRAHAVHQIGRGTRNRAVVQRCEVAVSGSCRYNLVVLPVKSW